MPLSLSSTYLWIYIHIFPADTSADLLRPRPVHVQQRALHLKGQALRPLARLPRQERRGQLQQGVASDGLLQQAPAPEDRRRLRAHLHVPHRQDHKEARPRHLQDRHRPPGADEMVGHAAAVQQPPERPQIQQTEQLHGGVGAVPQAHRRDVRHHRGEHPQQGRLRDEAVGPSSGRRHHHL